MPHFGKSFGILETLSLRICLPRVAAVVENDYANTPDKIAYFILPPTNSRYSQRFHAERNMPFYDEKILCTFIIIYTLMMRFASLFYAALFISHRRNKNNVGAHYVAAIGRSGHRGMSFSPLQRLAYIFCRCHYFCRHFCVSTRPAYYAYARVRARLPRSRQKDLLAHVAAG